MKFRFGHEFSRASLRCNLKTFLLFRFKDEEAYVCIYSHRNADTILFHHQGGVDIGDVDAKALKLDVPVDKTVTADDIKKHLLTHLAADKKVCTKETKKIKK